MRYGSTPERVATNFDRGSNGCVDTTPSNCCSRPNDRSGMEPTPTARNRPMSNRKADTRPNGHNEKAPNRGKHLYHVAARSIRSRLHKTSHHRHPDLRRPKHIHRSTAHRTEV